MEGQPAERAQTNAGAGGFSITDYCQPAIALSGWFKPEAWRATRLARVECAGAVGRGRGYFFPGSSRFAFTPTPRTAVRLARARSSPPPTAGPAGSRVGSECVSPITLILARTLSPRVQSRSGAIPQALGIAFLPCGQVPLDPARVWLAQGGQPGLTQRPSLPAGAGPRIRPGKGAAHAVLTAHLAHAQPRWIDRVSAQGADVWL